MSEAPSAWTEGKLELVDELVRRLEARFGPGIIYRLSRARPKIGAATVPTGSLGLDRATGIGGVPRGRFSVYRGGESSGKTTLAYHLLAEAQRDGGLAALIDGEGASDPLAMRACGVDLDDLILASPRDALEALEMVEILVRCRALDAIVASALPSARSGLLAHALKKLNVWLKEAPTAAVLVGSWESGVGGRGGERRSGGAGEREMSPGPRLPAPDPLSFYASLIVAFSQRRPIFGPGGDLVGLRVQAVVTKHRLAAPGGVAEFEVLRGRGLNRAAEVLELAEALGLVERLPLGLVWGRVFLGRSRPAAQAELESDPELLGELTEVVAGTVGALLAAPEAVGSDELGGSSPARPLAAISWGSGDGQSGAASSAPTVERGDR